MEERRLAVLKEQNAWETSIATRTRYAAVGVSLTLSRPWTLFRFEYFMENSVLSIFHEIG